MGANERKSDHAASHATSSNNEKEFSAKAIHSPDGIQIEDDSEGGVEGIDQLNLGVVLEDTLVDGGSVRVEGSLAGELLACIDDQGKCETLTNGTILPQRSVGAGDGFLLKFQGFTNHEDFILDLLLSFMDSTERFASIFNPATMLKIPSGRFGDEEDKTEDDGWYQHLEYDDHLPVPLAEFCDIFCASVVGPVSNEGPD